MLLDRLMKSLVRVLVRLTTGELLLVCGAVKLGDDGVWSHECLAAREVRELKAENQQLRDRIHELTTPDPKLQADYDEN